MAMTKLKWMLIVLVISLILTESYALSEASATGTDDWPTFRHDLTTAATQQSMDQQIR